MTVINLQRDHVWLSETFLAWEVNANMNDRNLQVNTDGVVYPGVGSAFADFTDSQQLSDQELASIGVMISPSNEDRVPVRVKAGAARGNASLWFGYVDTPGANVQTVTDCRMIQRGEIDDVFCTERLFEEDPNYGKALCFFLGCNGTNNINLGGFISVQRLIVQPPQFASAVS